MANPETGFSRLAPVESGVERQAILDAVSVIAPAFVLQSDHGQKLTRLALNPTIEGVEASPDGLFWTDRENNTKKFEAVATIYMTLNHHPANNTLAMSNSLPAYIKGHFDGDKVRIDKVELEMDSYTL